MIETIKYIGNWYIPGDANQCAGTLTFDPENGSYLELIGQLQGAMMFEPISLIHGRTSMGWVTLVDTRRRNGSYSNVTDIGMSVYEPSFILVGHAFKTEEEIAFRSVKFGLFNMLEWLEPKGIEQRQKENDYFLEFRKVEPITFQCSEECQGQIDFSMSHKYHKESMDIQVGDRVSMHLAYATKQKYSDILHDIFIFVRFITLCTYEQSYPIAIEFGDDDLTDEFVERHLKKAIPKQIRCYYRNAFFKSSYAQRQWHQHLVPVSAIKARLPFILTAWFIQASTLQQVIQILLRFFVDQYDFSIERFIDLIKAIEMFHRIKHPASAKSPEEFKEWVKRFYTPELADDDREWLESKINFGYEPTLKNRLKQLIELYSFPYFDQRVKDRKHFCQQVVDCRNYYTHFGKELKTKALSGQALFQLSESLKLLILSAILQGAEVPIDAVDDAMRRVI